MFCADYISAFLAHGLLSAGIIQYKNIESLEESFPGFHFLLGGLSGFLGAGAVYPFDFVRQGVIQGIKFRHSLSTVPYAGVFFGLYFSCREEQLSSQVPWAIGSASLACLAEVPFDKAKHVMMGSRKTMLMMNGLFIPFGALILVMYDKARIKYKKDNVN